MNNCTTHAAIKDPVVVERGTLKAALDLLKAVAKGNTTLGTQQEAKQAAMALVSAMAKSDLEEELSVVEESKSELPQETPLRAAPRLLASLGTVVAASGPNGGTD